ncbi:hypothetical protein ACWD04_31660 [Streptomyces sp. NPDC002911]
MFVPGNRRGSGRRSPGSDEEHGSITLGGRDGVYVVHRRGDFPGLPGGTEETLRHSGSGTVTALVTTELAPAELDEAVSLLAPVVNGAREARQPLRLAMSGAGLGDEDAPARRISDRLDLDVLAPAGAAVIVPGGTLFTPEQQTEPDAPAGWWYFSPGRTPRYAGLRHPVPVWEASLARIQPDLVDRHLLQTVPAGLLLRPTAAPAQQSDALGYAIPPDRSRPMLIVGVPGAPAVDRDAVETVLAALPGRVRDSVMLLPGDGRDLVPVAQEAADSLGLDLAVGNGLPVFLDQKTWAPEPRTTLVDAEGAPSWQPYVTSVVCVPAQEGRSEPPRVSSWRTVGTSGETAAPAPGVMELEGRWQVTLTRAGLWVSRPDWHTDAPLARAPETDAVAIELGVPGRGLDDTLWPQLERLFASLDPEVCERAIVRVHGNVGAEGLRTLRRLTVRYRLALAAKGPRAARTAEPSPALPDTAPAVPDQPVPEAVPTAAPAAPVFEATGTAYAPAETAGEESPSAVAVPPAPQRIVTASVDAAAAGPATAGAPWGSGHPDPWTAGPWTHVEAAVPGLTSGAVAVPGGAASPLASPGADAPATEEKPQAEHTPPPAGTVRPRTGGGPHPGSGAFHRAEQAEEAPAGEPPVEELPKEEAPPAGEPSRPGDRSQNGVREVQYIPFGPSHRSGPAEQERLRHSLRTEWEPLWGTVQRALTQLPGLRLADDEQGVRTDLVAVCAYLAGTGGLLDDDMFRDRVARDEPDTLVLLACVASGLGRLPSYRGAALRTAGIFAGDYSLLPGEELGEAVPVRAATTGSAYGEVAQDHYLIWSSTGRRTDLLSEPPGASGGLLFAPGTRFRVLQTRPRGKARTVLLRELAEHDVRTVPGRLDDTDRMVLEKLSSLADSPGGEGDSTAGVPGGDALGVLADEPSALLPS